MEAAFWLNRWEEDRTPWHHEAANPALVRHWPKLELAPAAQAFVPLCGASEDIAWLAQAGHPVLGVDLSERGLEKFIARHAAGATRQVEPPFTRFENDSPGMQISLLAGDIFDTSALLGSVAAVFDRAALVALPPAMRERYARHLLTHLSSGARILLLTYEYPDGDIEGPPFSVSPAEVEQLYAAANKITPLESRDIIEEESGLARRGVTALTQHAFIVDV